MPDWIGLYLEEDLGPDGVDGGRGDATSTTLLPEATGAARVVCRHRTFVAGTHHAVEVFRRLGASATARVEGAWADQDEVLVEVEGPARAILAGERTALNILARMGGVATATRRLVERLREAGSACQVAATRKTTPGFRAFEKEAVRIAGGEPYRMGLFDAAMVKDNHRAAAGDVAAAVARLRQAHPNLPIVVEAESREDAMAAASAGADWVMLDNQPPDAGRAWAEALRAAHPDVKVEASGGITADRVLAYAWADRVSLGCLTQAAPAADLSLEWRP